VKDIIANTAEGKKMKAILKGEMLRLSLGKLTEK
jgi:hypothetical protein